MSDMSHTHTVIDVRNVTKKYTDTPAIEGLSFDVQKGEMLAIVGPDGAGKTTTIRMLCGIIDPSEGDIEILDMDIRKEIDNIKPNIGYLSQRFSLYGDLSVDENIEFFAEIHGVRSYRQRRTELLDYMRLTPYRDRLADRLSGGMKQKLALACTLIHTPQILFLDEPTTGVDPVSRRDFWKILSDLLKEKITIVMATPYLDEAERCSRVGLMSEGKLLVIDAPQAVKSLMRGIVIEVVCDDIRKAYRLLRESSESMEVQAFGDRLHVIVHNEKSGIEHITGLIKDHGLNLSDIRLIPPSLENVFISLVRED
jgi:ABC-2 type transport system ATP-binding protein